MKAKKIVLGILAHVDAGKTTLSESILYFSGSIRKLGRVDHGNAFLDTDALERARGITIFSKQAQFTLGDLEITLLDTPGHVDFSAEMERTLQVLDYAVLVINGADGVQSHTATLWRLLSHYEIPVFLFINKMDQAGADRERLLDELHKRLDERCVDFGDSEHQELFYENLAMCEEALMEEYLRTGTLEPRLLTEAVAERRVFPCYFGSALKTTGVEEFLTGLSRYLRVPGYGEEFGAKVYKITRDGQGNRLTHLKVTGGILKVKMALTNGRPAGAEDGPECGGGGRRDGEEARPEKVDQIRIYSGAQFTAVDQAEAGTVCAVTGLSRTRAGEGLGSEEASDAPLLEPVLNYRLQLPPSCEVHGMLLKLRQLEEEEPQLHIVWDEQSGEIHAQVMGEIELEILKSLIRERFGVDVEFGTGSIVYKETIAAPVEGVGHFEPLRHYAEVHLLMEPGEPGSGLHFDSRCGEDQLDRNWQRLVLTHLKEKKHRGVLTGSEITDMKITLVAGKAHQKHTEGGDFRQATYRAVRQGLKKADSVLLEPVYEFQLEVPTEMVGRALADLQRMNGTFDPPESEGTMSTVRGSAPVSAMSDYQAQVLAYTKGQGRLFLALKGYEPCADEKAVVEAIGYDSERDTDHPTGSVFCAHGAGFAVSWEEVERYMHVDSGLRFGGSEEDETSKKKSPGPLLSNAPGYANEKELEEIFLRTYGTGKGERNRQRIPKRVRGASTAEMPTHRPKTSLAANREKYLLVDGYNIIFAWEELKELAEVSLDGARDKLIEILGNYQGYKGGTLILVFDAYKVAGNPGSVLKYQDLYVIYTKEAETADQYIERAVHRMGEHYDVTVATSDRLVQMIIWGEGARRLSAQELKAEVEAVSAEIRSDYLGTPQELKWKLETVIPT